MDVSNTVQKDVRFFVLRFFVLLQLQSSRNKHINKYGLRPTSLYWFYVGKYIWKVSADILLAFVSYKT